MEQQSTFVCKNFSENTGVGQVAHRLESVMGCDAVVVMEEGRIVETGLPMQLLAAKGSRFAAMHRAAQRGSMMSPAP